MVFFRRFPICKLVWLMVVPGAWAQSTTSVVTAASAATALPLTPFSPGELAYVSVLAQYKAYAEQAVSSWPQANATVERIGGWRAYAKEAAAPPVVPPAPGAQP